MGRRAATLAGASCQEPKKGPKGELHSKKPQPQPEPQESGPSWARPQLPAAQPPASQPRRPPQRSGGQDAPRRGSLQHSLQPGPSPRTDCRPQAWPPILPGSGQWGVPLPASPVPRMPVHTALPQPPRDPATPASGCVCHPGLAQSLLPWRGLPAGTAPSRPSPAPLPSLWKPVTCACFCLQASRTHASLALPKTRSTLDSR